MQSTIIQEEPQEYQIARIAQLRRELDLPPIPPDPGLPPLTDRDLDAEEGFLRYLATIDSEPTTTHARKLITDDIELPSPDSLTPGDVRDKLWQVIHGLARHRTFLCYTDHLSDLELYKLLWKEVLNHDTYDLDEGMGDCACHIDLLGDGSEQSNRIWLKFYADHADRALWKEEFPEDEIPDHCDPPFERDRYLPQR